MPNKAFSQDISALFGLPQVPTLPEMTQAIKQEMYDTDLYKDMLDFSPVLQDIVARGNNSLATFDNLIQDMYLALFKLKPELSPTDNIKPEYQKNHQIIAALLENEDYQQMHTMTRLDSVAAGMGAQVLAEKILAQLEQLSGEEKQNTSTTEAMANAIQDKLDATCKSSLKEMDEIMDMGKAWGIEPGNPNARISYKSKRKALERLRSSPKLKNLTDLVGRFREIAIKCYKRAAEGISSIRNVSVGGDLEQVLPSEKMLLANNITKKDFFRRFHQQELLQYQCKGIYPKGRGPMVVCCDVSGSMRGKAEEWSKAMVMALAEVAQREKRDFACILFDNQLEGTWIIPRGIWDPSILIDICETFPGGGTNFTYPLEKSLELINISKFKAADVIMISDGKCNVPKDLLKRLNQLKARKGFIIATVLIDVDNDSIEAVKQFSDEVIAVSSLADLNDDIAGKLISNF